MAGTDGRRATGDQSQPLGASAMAALEWRLVRSEVAFRIGRLGPFTVGLGFLKCETHFLHMPVQDAPVAPIEAMRRHSVVAAKIVSCPLGRRLPRVSWQDGYLRCVTWQYRHQFIRLRPSFAEYERDLSRKARSTLRRKVRKFVAANGGHDLFRAYCTPEEVAPFLEAARQVSATSYQERFLGEGIPRDDAFEAKLIDLCAAGQAVGCVLSLSGRPVAYTLCEGIGAGVGLYSYTGINASVRDLSPGTVLHYLLIEFLHQTRMFEIYDLNLGEAEHKRRFANEERPCADILFVRATPHGLAVAAAYLGAQTANDLKGRVARRVVGSERQAGGGAR